MRGRNFIALVAGIVALPLAAHAQQAVPSIAQAASTDTSKCAQNSVGFPQRLDGPRWNGWGADLGNSRFQPAEMAGLTRDQVPSLRLKWAFGFLGRSSAVAQPTIVGGLLFVGGGDREVYALDAKSGCTRWAFKTEAVVRTAISFGPISGTDQFAVFFGDLYANAYAVNAITGALIWKTKVEDHPAALITGAPTLYSGICTCRFLRKRRPPGRRPPTNVVPFAAASSRSIVRRASRSGRATQFPRPRVRPSGMPLGPNSMVRPARRCGRRRPSMSCVRRSMSRQGTIIPTLPRKPAMLFLRLILRPAGCSGIGRLPQTTATSPLASSVTTPIVRKVTVRTTTLVNRQFW